MMTELGPCIKCGAEIEKETWVAKFGFCTPKHYTEYMTEHRLWSRGDPSYSPEHYDPIVERLVESIDEEMLFHPFFGIERLAWLDNAIKALWALVALDILYVLFA